MDARDKATTAIVGTGLALTIAGVVALFGTAIAALAFGIALLVVGLLVGAGLIGGVDDPKNPPDPAPAYIVGLQAEYVAYMATGKLDKAQGVVDELARFGMTPGGDDE